jgi:hypothetical protein
MICYAKLYEEECWKVDTQFGQLSVSFGIEFGVTVHEDLNRKHYKFQSEKNKSLLRVLRWYKWIR